MSDPQPRRREPPPPFPASTLVAFCCLLLATVSLAVALASARSMRGFLTMSFNGEETQNGVRQFISESERRPSEQQILGRQWFLGSACCTTLSGAVGAGLLFATRPRPNGTRGAG